MSLDARQMAILGATFDRLRTSYDAFSTDFYDDLFQRAPELRALFREDLTGQGMKFVTTLRQVIFHVQNPEREVGELEELGHYHGSIGVLREHFAPMEEALIDTLKATLGPVFDDEAEEAWRKAYGEMVEVMIARGEIPAA